MVEGQEGKGSSFSRAETSQLISRRALAVNGPTVIDPPPVVRLSCHGLLAEELVELPSFFVKVELEEACEDTRGVGTSREAWGRRR